jgi:hypothetical protein
MFIFWGSKIKISCKVTVKYATSMKALGNEPALPDALNFFVMQLWEIPFAQFVESKITN